MVCISNISTLELIYYAYFHSIIKYGTILGVTLPTVWRLSLYKRKSSELWLVHNPEREVDVLFKQLEILPVPHQYILSLTNLIVSSHVIFQTHSSIHKIKKGISIIFIDLSCFQKSTIYASIQIFNSLPTSVTIVKNDKTKFKAALRKYINTHAFYSVDEFVCV